jgi:hypothetical protein
MYHDIAIMRESNNNKKLDCKTIWHVSAKEMVNFKMSKFFVSKSKMPKYIYDTWRVRRCEVIQSLLSDTTMLAKTRSW